MLLLNIKNFADDPAQKRSEGYPHTSGLPNLVALTRIQW